VLGKVRLGYLMTGYDILGQDTSGYVGLCSVGTGEVRIGRLATLYQVK
jgi:hypothetical protein